MLVWTVQEIKMWTHKKAQRWPFCTRTCSTADVLMLNNVLIHTALLQDYCAGFRVSFSVHIIHTHPSYLNESVLWPKPSAVCRRSWVQRADILSRPWPITVKVKAVARLRPCQVTQTGCEFRWVDLGLRLGLGLRVGFSLGYSLLQDSDEYEFIVVKLMFV